MENSVSGIILTHNNERTIEKAVRSVLPLISELIIVDDDSTDRTLEIVRGLHADVRVISRKLNRFDEQRNAGIEAARGKWVLMIDSDEEVEEALAQSIKAAAEKGEHEAYQCTIVNMPFGAKVRLCLERPLLFKQHLRFERPLHERLNAAHVGWLSGDLLHHAWIDAADWIDDMNQYSTHQARRWIVEGREYSKFALFWIGLCMPVWHFLKLYIGQGRFKNGAFAGLLYSLACGSEWMFVALKYYELRYGSKRGNIGEMKE